MKARMLVTTKYLTDILVYPGLERPAGVEALAGEVRDALRVSTVA